MRINKSPSRTYRGWQLGLKFGLHANPYSTGIHPGVLFYCLKMINTPKEGERPLKSDYKGFIKDYYIDHEIVISKILSIPKIEIGKVMSLHWGIKNTYRRKALVIGNYHISLVYKGFSIFVPIKIKLSIQSFNE